MTYIDDPAFNIDPRLVARYLKHSGWRVEDFGRKIERISHSDDGSTEAVEIFFDRSSSPEKKRKEVFFAVKTISDFYEKAISSVVKEINAITYDQLASKIPNEYVRNDSLELRVASQYINQMKTFLSTSATTEITGERSFKRTLKEAIQYAEHCRFGHTFRGSFGFLIESPVGLNDAPSLEVVDEKPPLSRKIVERIARGLSAYTEAVEEQSPGIIARRANGFSANMCDAMADLLEETTVSKMEIGIRFSPEWRSEFSREHITLNSSENIIFIVEYKNIDILREAAKSLRVDEKPRPVTVFGRIRRVETDGNPADLLEDTSTREIEINWASDENTLLHVKVMLSPGDYLKAVEAHKDGKPVHVSGMLIKSGRSWRLDNAENFQVIAV